MYRVMVLVCALFMAATALAGQSAFLTSCTDDNRIDATKRKEIEASAMDFVTRLLSGTPDSAYGLLSTDAKANVTQEQVVQQSLMLLRPMEIKALTATKTYLVHITGNSPQRVVCGELADDRWDSVGAVNAPEQAHVIISGETINNKVAFAVWLVRFGKEWQVQSYWMNVSTLADKGPSDLRALGREQLARKHFFNATLLYVAALQLANRGPSFQMGITQSLSTEMANIEAPKEVQGQPPFVWSDGRTEYRVLNIGPIAVGGKIYIAINHQVGTWKTDEQVDGWNKQLIGYFKVHFPEYRDSFAGLVIRAREEGTNRGYGTVEEIKQ